MAQRQQHGAPSSLVGAREEVDAIPIVSRVGRFLLRRDPPTWREMLGMFGLVSAVGTLIYRSHIVNGGLYVDDWTALAWTRFHVRDDPIDAFDGITDIVGWRFLGLASNVVRFLLFGEHTKWHLASTLGVTVSLCALLYLLLRNLRLEPLHSAAIALLVLVCPYADATRLWTVGSGVSMGIGAWLLGVVVALRGLGMEDRQKAIWWHAGALVLYVVSMQQYEITFVAILGSWVLYLTRAPWRRVVPRAAVDICVVSLVAALMAAHTALQRTSSYVDHAESLLTGGLELFAAVALPYGHPRSGVVLTALALVAAAGVAARWFSRWEAERQELLRWTMVGGCGLLLVIAGYAVFISGSDYYAPVRFGLANRTNALATIGMIVTIYAIAMLASTLIAHRVVHRRRLVLAASVLVSAFLFVGYQDRLRDSTEVWHRAYAQYRWVLGAVRGSIPELPSNSTVLTFGHPTLSERYELPSVWALTAGVQVVYDDGSLAAYPAIPRSRIRCGSAGAYLTGFGPETIYLLGGRYGSGSMEEYGRLYLLDVPTGRVERVNSRGECRAVATEFRPGPLLAPARAVSRGARPASVGRRGGSSSSGGYLSLSFATTPP